MHSHSIVECPTCGATLSQSTAGAHGDFCSDACALCSSERLFEILEREIARLTPHIGKDEFLQAMEHLAEDLSLDSKQSYRPLRKASASPELDQTRRAASRATRPASTGS